MVSQCVAVLDLPSEEGALGAENTVLATLDSRSLPHARRLSSGIIRKASSSSTRATITANTACSSSSRVTITANTAASSISTRAATLVTHVVQTKITTPAAVHGNANSMISWLATKDKGEEKATGVEYSKGIGKGVAKEDSKWKTEGSEGQRESEDHCAWTERH